MKKILIASASNSFIDRNSTLLRRSDFTIFSANSSADTLEILSLEKPDLIISDHNLQDMDGEAVCKLVRNNQAGRRVAFILVCRDDDDEFARLSNCGADALIAKPIKPLQLIKTVGQFLTIQLVRSRRVSLRVKVISKKDIVEFYCISHNVSVTGMLIETEYFLEERSVINCLFTLPGSIQVETEGEVVRTARTMDGAYQYGIQFTSLNRMFRQEIDRYISATVRGEIQPV